MFLSCLWLLLYNRALHNAAESSMNLKEPSQHLVVLQYSYNGQQLMDTVSFILFQKKFERHTFII